MAEGKNQQRTKYSLDGNVPKSFPNFLRPFDALCDPEGARIVNTATGEATVAGVVGPSPSTLFSAIGSLFIWVIFVVWAYMIFTAYQRDPPIIYEKTLDTPRDFEAPFPDFALTLSLTPRDFYVANQIRQIKAAHGSSKTRKEAEWEARDQWRLLSEDEQNVYACEKDNCESRTLEHLWPVFRWEKVFGGLEESMDKDNSLLGPEDGLHFGDDCGLSAGGKERWPVFCFLNTKLPSEKQRKLRGRDFGDPIWSFLDLRIVRCTNMSTYPRGVDPDVNVSAPFPWSGTCRPHDDINALVDWGDGLPLNMFFKLPSEPDWSESRWDKPRPPMRPPEENGMVGQWTYHVYEKMSSSSAMYCKLYLKHTEAMINLPLSFGIDTLRRKVFSLGRKFKETEFDEPHRWFDFDRHVCQREYIDDARFAEYGSLYRWDYTGHVDGENRTRFFDSSVRMNHKRRVLDVRRQNLREMLSEISGSWEISLFLGWLIVVVINHALKAANACPRSRKEAKDVWAGTCGRGAPGAAPKVAPAKAPAAAEAAAPAPAAEPAPAPAAEAPLSPAAKRWKFLAMNWKRLKRQMQSANYFQLLNSAPPEAPAPPPLDPRKFAELLERVEQLEKRLEEQPRRS